MFKALSHLLLFAAHPLAKATGSAYEVLYTKTLLKHAGFNKSCSDAILLPTPTASVIFPGLLRKLPLLPAHTSANEAGLTAFVNCDTRLPIPLLPVAGTLTGNCANIKEEDVISRSIKKTILFSQLYFLF